MNIHRVEENKSTLQKEAEMKGSADLNRGQTSYVEEHDVQNCFLCNESIKPDTYFFTPL
jgi:hypothetical protein